MKRKTGWLIAVAALLALATWGVFAVKNAWSASATAASKTMVPIRPSSSFLLKAVGRTQRQLAFKEQMKQIQARQAKLQEQLKRSTSKITKEMRQIVTESYMRRREPYYRTLFESWDMDASTCDEVLKVVRERETRIQEALYHVSETGNPRDYVDGKNREQRLAAQRIMDLIGDEHYAEFARFETDASNEETASSQSRFRTPVKRPPPATKP